MTTIALRAGVPSIVRVATRLIDERPVVWVDVDASDRQGALSSTSSEQIAAGADFALNQRVPLVVVVRSSGADISEGIAALHGWGHAARALANCSGIVPVAMITWRAWYSAACPWASVTRRRLASRNSASP